MDCNLPASPVHGISPGKITGVGCHFLLQGIFPTQGLNPHLRVSYTAGRFLTAEPPGKPTAYLWQPFSKSTPHFQLPTIAKVLASVSKGPCVPASSCMPAVCLETPGSPQSKPGFCSSEFPLHNILLLAKLNPLSVISTLCLCMLSRFSYVQLCDSMDLARQAPLSMEFSGKEYWSGFPCPSLGDISSTFR